MNTIFQKAAAPVFALGVGFGASHAANAGKVILDFEELAPVAAGANPIALTGNLSPQNFKIQAEFLGVVGSDSDYYAGSVALENNLLGGTTVLTESDGSSFDLVSVDLSQYSSPSIVSAFKSTPVISSPY